MPRSSADLDVSPAGFFALRTPLLPVDELEGWGSGLAAACEGADREDWAAVLEGDRGRLRGRLRELLERPEIREALFVASPSLVDGLAIWQERPDSKKGRRAEAALVRYLERMMTRATPFGLFSGCSVGTVAEASRLELAPRRRYRRHTRLDMDYLFALAEDLGRDPDLRRRLIFRPNSSLYLAAGRFRYAEARLAGNLRSHHLVAVEASEYLDTVLELARRGATVEELCRALVKSDPEGEITSEDAEEFVFEVIESQMLVSELTPLVTGSEPIHDLLEQLADLPETAHVRERLAYVREALAELDEAGLGRATESYREIARRLEELPTRLELPRLFQVDMVKPVAEATLGASVIDELLRGVDILWRLQGAAGEDSLTRFRSDFLERYQEGQAVPLAEVLDEEVGLGFDRSRGADASPLIEGLAFPERAAERTLPWNAYTDLLLRKVEEALTTGAREIEILEEDLEDFPRAGLPPLPDSFQVMASIAAESAESVAAGEYELFLRSGSGPSGAQLLGRFCHADPELRGHVEGLLRAEEALRPDAVFAEVVHLPEGRIGNILSRPRMREHEIPFLGRGGGRQDQLIPISDLLVSVMGREIVLSSKRLGRRVLPRLTSAHNFDARSLGLYRFLCGLQMQGVRGGFTWNWGLCERFSFLPRVRCGRLVFARARWRVERDEIQKLLEGDAAATFCAARAWRRQRRIPRRVLLVDFDNELWVDFENVLSLEAFLSVVKARPRCDLMEVYPGPDKLLARGPEGRFQSELVVPFTRRARPREPTDRAAPARPVEAPSAEAPAAEELVAEELVAEELVVEELVAEELVAEVSAADERPAEAPAVRRSFAPGSEWLYAKLYTGTSTADRVFAEVMGPLARQAVASGAAERWFFLRYGDPHWHLRLRLNGRPERLRGEVLPRLAEAAGVLVEEGQIWRCQLDTYDRELERYGGGGGIELAERLFHADSEAVLSIVELLEGDEGARARWHLAVRGIDQLIRDFGLAGEEKLRLLERMAGSFAREFEIDTPFKKRMSDRLRQERKELQLLLTTAAPQDHPFAPGLAAFDRRSEALRPILGELRARAAAGRLSSTPEELLPSFIHMFCNRLLRSDGRAQEVVLYDFVHRLTLSEIARARRR